MLHTIDVFVCEKILLLHKMLILKIITHVLDGILASIVFYIYVIYTRKKLRKVSMKIIRKNILHCEKLTSA